MAGYFTVWPLTTFPAQVFPTESAWPGNIIPSVHLGHYIDDAGEKFQLTATPVPGYEAEGKDG